MRSIAILRLLLLSACLLAPGMLSAQVLKKLGKKAQRAAERTVERRVEQESAKKTDQVLDSILTPGNNEDAIPGENPAPGATEPPAEPGKASSIKVESGLQVYSNYDFEPGETLVWYDDFAPDAVGDFPAQWNTNGTGEIVTLSGTDGKWLKLANGSVYVPEFPNDLPENFTLEFDMITKGLDRQTSSTARLLIRLEEDQKLFRSNSYAHVSIPLAQYIDAGIRVQNRFNGETTVNNSLNLDVRNAVLDRAHLAFAINGPRLRLWMNERKLVDLPRFLEPGVVRGLKFELTQLPGESKDQYLFLANLRIAETGEDLRSALLKEGRFTTTGIHFESGSSKLRPESAAVLQPLSELLKQQPELRLQIIGHTDADGETEANQELSLQRAAAVKTALTESYQVAAERLEVSGKGESQPLAENDTAHGKAQNRRVEFVKL